MGKMSCSCFFFSSALLACTRSRRNPAVADANKPDVVCQKVNPVYVAADKISAARCDDHTNNKKKKMKKKKKIEENWKRPMVMSPFSTLRAINLSSNSIVHISPGSLPKCVHSLDLSRNNLTTMDGLRHLTKLRVLNMSYNKISRIGQGLSRCTKVRELYMAGNRVSQVEGLHRLLKLALLDLGFNRVTTAKALMQLVVNYQSILEINLLGNPVHVNVGDEALRKAVTGLLPNLVCLNNQTISKQHRSDWRRA